MSRAARLALVLGVVMPLLSAPIHASERSSRSVQAGYDAAFNLDHDRALATLSTALRENPDDPAAHRAIAVVSWLRILFMRGAVLVDNYLLGSVSAANLRSGSASKPPEDLDDLFRTHIERSIELAKAEVRRSPDDADAQYELGTSLALAASYKATIEGEPLRALRDAKDAYTAHERVIEIDPGRKDANLILGLYRYLVSILPRAFRMVAYLVGFDGGKEEALRLIEEAAAYPGETQTEARIALVVLYNREEEFASAQRVLGDLKQRYPRNRIFWLESASTWLRDDRAEMARLTLQEGFSKLADDDRERMYGEETVWQLKRASAHVALGDTAQAMPDLIAIQDAETRLWVQGQAHIELGKIADLEGDRTTAREQYDQGRRLCRQAKHRQCVEEAEELKELGYALDTQ